MAKILVVDDDADLRHTVKESLQEESHEVYEAAS